MAKRCRAGELYNGGGNPAVYLASDYDALEADRDQISLTLDVAKADRDKWFNRARDLEKALRAARPCVFNSRYGSWEEVLRVIDAALTAPETACESPWVITKKQAIEPTHEAADAFWKYWRENGEAHKHGYYESTWGAINAALNASDQGTGEKHGDV